MGPFKWFDLGLIEFKKALEFQEEIFLKVKNESLPGAWIVCRHYPVITKARKSPEGNIIASAAELARLHIRVEPVNRGGDATYHGPGQLMLYPIIPLRHWDKDIRLFIGYLEHVALGLLKIFSVPAELKYGLSGVWVKEQKIASIGITVSSWISSHGMAVNVCKGDLDGFRLVRPCGMDVSMTSMESVLKRQVDIEEVSLKLRAMLQGHVPNIDDVLKKQFV